MRFVVYIALTSLVQVAHSQVRSDFQVLYNGSPSGFSKWTEGADGAFTSSTEIDIGAIKLTGEVHGHFKGPRLVDFDGSTSSPNGSGTLSYKDGVIHATSLGKTRSINYTPKQDVYGASLHPGPWFSAAKWAIAALKDAQAGTAKRTSVFLIDGGTELPATFRMLPSKSLRINGATQSVNRLQVSLASVQFELDTDAQGNVVAEDVPGQKLRFVVRGWEGLYVDPLAAYPELSQPTLTTKFQSNVRVPMRDGVTLATDFTMPQDAGKYPAILIRTPYGRDGEDVEGEFFAKRGYVVVCQDCRGKGDSGGVWDPFVNEGNDGYDTIQWIAKQPWCSGNVGMIGASYVGYVQWAAAVKRPAALKCIVPQVSPPDAMHNLPYDFGIPFLYGDVWWAKIVAAKGTDMSSLHGPLPNPAGLAVLPLDAVDQAALHETVPFYHDWLKRTTEGDWKGWDFLAHIDQANVPALHISGWWDGDGIGTKLNWAAERRLGRTDQWLIYGPWSHAFNSASAIGKVDYGSTAILELDSLYLRWFDTWLKGKSVGLEKVPHVRAFVTGANKWVNLGDWSEKSEQAETLYLREDKKHRASFGKVSVNDLTTEVPSAGRVGYVYDPATDTETSVLSKGSAASEEFTGVSDLGDSKTAVLEFRSAPLTKDTAIAGPAVVDVYFKSSAKDTDLYAVLVELDEAGKAHPFGQTGKIRASYREGMDRIVPLIPGKVTHVQILPWDFAHEIKKGHRIGLVIVPSGFPLYARNLGTIGPVATNKTMAIQRNEVLLGGLTPSKVTFHVLWEK